MLTAEKLRASLSYDPQTGIFRWLVAGGQKRVGDIAGRINQQGYRQIQICGRMYQSARLAWLYVHGRWSTLQIDHINRVRSDDRLTNLREASAAQNCQNRKPARGTTLHSSGKWQAKIVRNGRSMYLGLFESECAAASAYQAALARFQDAIR